MPRNSKYFFSNSCSDLVTENCHFSKNNPYIFLKAYSIGNNMKNMPLKFTILQHRNSSK